MTEVDFWVASDTAGAKLFTVEILKESLNPSIRKKVQNFLQQRPLKIEYKEYLENPKKKDPYGGLGDDNWMLDGFTMSPRFYRGSYSDFTKKNIGKLRRTGKVIQMKNLGDVFQQNKYSVFCFQ